MASKMVEISTPTALSEETTQVQDRCPDRPQIRCSSRSEFIRGATDRPKGEWARMGTTSGGSSVR